jgi:nitrite transporter NirC
MEIEALNKVEELALKKLAIYEQNPLRYILRSILASMFIGFGVIVAFKTGNYFYLVHSPMAYPMAAITFTAAIILIVYGGGDLFTGNTFYFSYAALRKRISWGKVIKLSTVSYIGNFIGACVFALLIYLTGLYESETVNLFLLKVVETKMAVSTTELFFRAILCNWLICLAFFIPMSLRDEGPKMFVMVLLVFCFFISGYEHSIANMCTFAIALVLKHVQTISWAGLVHNLIPVTIGNIFGGSFMMAVFYHFLNKPYFKDSNKHTD